MESQILYAVCPSSLLIELDNNKFIIDCQINQNSIIELILNSSGAIIIFIRASSAKVIALALKRIENLKNVKFELQFQEKIPKNIQLLYFNGKLLEGAKNLEDYGIQNYSTIDLNLNNKELIFFPITFYNIFHPGRILEKTNVGTLGLKNIIKVGALVF